MEVTSGFMDDDANDLVEDIREGAHSLVFETDGRKAAETTFWRQVACLRVGAECRPKHLRQDTDEFE